MSEIQLRSFRASDRIPLYRVLASPLKAQYSDGLAWLDKKLDEVLLGKAFCSLAMDNDKIAGCAIESEKGCGRRKLSTFYIHPAYRQGEVARKLWNLLETRWLDANLEKVHMTVPATLVKRFERVAKYAGCAVIAMEKGRYIGAGNEKRDEAVLQWSPVGSRERLVTARSLSDFSL